MLIYTLRTPSLSYDGQIVKYDVKPEGKAFFNKKYAFFVLSFQCIYEFTIGDVLYSEETIVSEEWSLVPYARRN